MGRPAANSQQITALSWNQKVHPHKSSSHMESGATRCGR